MTTDLHDEFDLFLDAKRVFGGRIVNALYVDHSEQVTRLFPCLRRQCKMPRKLHTTLHVADKRKTEVSGHIGEVNRR